MPTYKIAITEHFKKQLKSLVKKNLRLRDDLLDNLEKFNKGEEIHIGHGVYKIRLASNSKGKSGGYRLYILIIEIQGLLAPICIYSKNEKSNLNKAELTYHMNKVNEELGNLLLL